MYHKESRCYWFSTSNQGNLREYNLIGVVSLQSLVDQSLNDFIQVDGISGL